MENEIDDDVEWALAGMRRAGKRLTFVSVLLLSVTCFHTLILAMLSSGLGFLARDGYMLLSAILTMAVFFGAIFFDSTRKHGKSYFDEMSGALHGHTSRFIEGGKKNHELLRVRVQVSQYFNTTDIPLVPGKFGPGIVLIFNLILMGLIVLQASYRYQ